MNKWTARALLGFIALVFGLAFPFAALVLACTVAFVYAAIAFVCLVSVAFGGE